MGEQTRPGGARRGGRVHGMAGRPLAAAAVFGRVGRAGCVRAGRLARGIYMVLPRHGSGRDTATPRSVARQELPCQRSPRSALATSALCRATMHGAAQAFGRARAIGAAKSVSFKKTSSVRFKINFQKVLKLKKNRSGSVKKMPSIYRSKVVLVFVVGIAWVICNGEGNCKAEFGQWLSIVFGTFGSRATGRCLMGR